MEQQTELLAKADMELRPGEFVAIRLACAGVGALASLFLSEWQVVAVVPAVAGYEIPLLYAKWRQNSGPPSNGNCPTHCS